MNSVKCSTERPLWTVCWSPCGTMVATAGTDRIIRIYTVTHTDNNILITLQAELRDAHTKTIRSLHWHDHLLAAASFDGTVSIWSTINGFKCVAKLEGHENEVKSVRFSPDGRHIATCGRDRTVWIWSVFMDDDHDDNPEFECEAVLQEHSQDVKCLEWHPSGDILFSGSYDNTIKMFACPMDVDEWLCMGTLEDGHASTVWSLGWHDNKLYSVSDDRSIIRWSDTNTSSNKFNMALRADLRVENVHEEAIYGLVVCEGVVVTGGADCQMCMTDPKTGMVVNRISMNSQINQLAVYKHLIAVALDSGELCIIKY